MNQLNYILCMGYEPEWLLGRLRDHMSNPEGFFRKLVIVPSGIIKNRIYKKLLEDKVAMGCKILQLPMAIDYLMRLVTFEDKKPHAFPAASLISLHLEILIQALLECQKTEEFFAPLERYLSDTDAAKRHTKIQELSDMLSREFLHYGLYGGRAFEKWFEQKSWQTKLWDQLFVEWDYPYKIFNSSRVLNPLNLQMEIHLFGFTFIPTIYEEFFHRLSSFFPIYNYYLNPCAYFWGDICSEKERFFLHKRYRKKGVALGELAQLDDYLQSRHKLLANFGKQTQRRFNMLLDQGSALDEQPVESLLEQQPTTLLQGIQKDILQGKEEITPRAHDLSIQLHEVSSKKREIEVLLALLKDITYRENIVPSDILVLAPDISEYFPFIHQVFHAEENPFPIEIHDLNLLSQSPFLQGFWEILCLKEKRWEQKDLFQLLMLRPFADRHGFTAEQVMQMKKWAEAAYITWGFDKRHREELLLVQGGSPSELSEVGTWKYGMERLLFGLVNTQVEISEELACYYPMEEVQMLQAELLGDFIQLIESLYEEMQFFSSARLPITAWVEYFQALAEKYFLIDAEDIASKQSFDFFLEQLKMLVQLSHKVEDAVYPFSSMKRFIYKAFSKKGASLISANQEAICFASLKSQQIYPAQVIYLLGMEEGVFPRGFLESPLREMEEKQMDFSPTMLDEDRQMMLDVILHAQRYCIMSYASVDAKDGQEKNVSFLVEEFLDFVKNHLSDAKSIHYVHKSFSFHEEELMQPFYQFSQRAFRLAQSIYSPERPKQRLIPEFYHSDSVNKGMLGIQDIVESLSLKDLKKFAKNPLQYYFNRALGLYINKKETDAQRAQREFLLSTLDKARFRMDTLGQEFDAVYQKLDVLGALPSGLFKEIAKDQLMDDRQELLRSFEELGLEISEGMTLELSTACKQPIQKKEKYWLVPHLEIELEGRGVMKIEGVLDNITSKGLGFHGKNCLQDHVKIWPIYLIFHQVVSTYFPGKIQTQLLLTKDAAAKSFPSKGVQEALKKYLSYYLKAQHTPSPLFPTWAEALFSPSMEHLAKVIQTQFALETEKRFLDEYHAWSLNHLEPFSAQALHHLWHADLVETFSPLMRWCNSGEDHA